MRELLQPVANNACVRLVLQGIDEIPMAVGFTATAGGFGALVEYGSLMSQAEHGGSGSAHQAAHIHPSSESVLSQVEGSGGALAAALLGALAVSWVNARYRYMRRALAADHAAS